VSLHSVLAHYGLIPEYVPLTTSVTTGRPGLWKTPLGPYDYRHVRKDLLIGYRRTALADDQEAFLATPEKALLDLIYLPPDANSPKHLQELRLQHLGRLDPAELHLQAEGWGSPSFCAPQNELRGLALIEAEEYEPL